MRYRTIRDRHMTLNELVYYVHWTNDLPEGLVAAAASLRVLGPTEPIRSPQHDPPPEESTPGAWMPYGRVPYGMIEP